MRDPSTKKNGFTLLEIIVVLFLITLILGLSGVFVAGFLPSAKVKATGREMTAMIRHARSVAHMKMEKQAVVIDLDNRTYGIEGNEIKYLPVETAVSIRDPIAGDVIQGKYVIVLPPTGGMGGCIISLARKKQVIRIKLDPITGATMIKDGPS